MYKQIAKIKNVDMTRIHDGFLYVAKFFEKRAYKRIYKYDEYFNQVWESPQDNCWDIYFIKDMFIYILYDDKGTFGLRSTDMEEIYEIGCEVISINGHSEKLGTQLVYTYNKEIWLFDFLTGTIVKRFPIPSSIARRSSQTYLSEKNFFFYDTQLKILRCFDYNLQEQWSVHLPDIGIHKYEPQNFEVGEMCVYKEQLLVFEEESILVLDVHNGRLIKQVPDVQECRNIKIEGSICYFSSTGSFSALDLNKLEIISSFQYHDLPYKDDSRWVIGSNFTIKDGLIWFVGDCNAFRAIICMDPFTGEYLWHEIIKGAWKCKPPLFLNDKMYIVEYYTGILYVYEKKKSK